MTTYYTQDHEWIAVEGGTATVGITDYAQAQLGDIVFVELPAPGTALEIEVRGKRLAATVTPMPFVPHHYVRKGAA